MNFNSAEKGAKVKEKIKREETFQKPSPRRAKLPDGKESHFIRVSFFDEAKNFSFENTEANPDDYFQDYITALFRSTGSDLLIRFLKTDAPVTWKPERLRCFLSWLFKVNSRVLNTPDLHSKKTPLIYALDEKLDIVVETILKEENLAEILQKDSAGTTCLHSAICNQSPSLKQIIVECQRFPDLFQRIDSLKNTPLHLMVEALGEEASEKCLIDVLEPELERLGKDIKLSPQDQSQPTVQKDELDQHSEGQSAVEEAEMKPIQSVEARLEILKQIVEVSGSALSHVNKAGMTPYQLRVYKLESSRGVREVVERLKFKDDCNNQPEAIETLRERAKRLIIINDKLAEYIRTFCICNMEKTEDITQCLYQPGKEKHIDFDLAGLPRPSIPAEFLHGLANHIQFESVLRYVALPKLVVEPPKGTRLATRPVVNDLRVIFDWLRKNHVKRIIKVAVIDYGNDCHKDSAIIKAMDGFQVEYWNWKKVDLCSDVITESTKSIKDLSLYWSGNSAVLMGWASTEAFSDKDKFPKLKHIQIFFKEGYEETEELFEQLRAFKERIEQCPSNISVNYLLDNQEFSYASDFRSSTDTQEDGNRWIECVARFSGILRSFKIKPKVDPIKIAIIDDGIDATLSDLQRRIVAGKSFSPYVNSGEFWNAYFVPSGQHGTLMAKLICKLCPKPQLYIARLEERLAEGGGRRITAKSAAEAVDWAVSCKVDIISMSWTIETRVQNSLDIERLEGAILEAQKNDILMFCSTSDQGGSREEHTYPGEFGHCFRIGGASDKGDKLTWVNESQIDFLFPGKRIPFRDEEKKSYFYETGSSLATACASGLAGALLYASRAFDKFVDLKKRDNMNNAFLGLAKGRKFPDVEKQLEERFRRNIEELKKKKLQDQAGEKSVIPLFNMEDLEWEDNTVREALKDLLEFIISRGLDR